MPRDDLHFTVKPAFYISDGPTSNECKIKELKMYVDTEIKYIKLILYYTKNVIHFNAGCTNPGHQDTHGTKFCRRM
jgi:hypothetical protein